MYGLLVSEDALFKVYHLLSKCVFNLQNADNLWHFLAYLMYSFIVSNAHF